MTLTSIAEAPDSPANLVGKDVVVTFRDGRPAVTGRLHAAQRPDGSAGVTLMRTGEGLFTVDALVIASVEAA